MDYRAMGMVVALTAGIGLVGCSPNAHIDRVATTASDVPPDAMILVAGLT